MALSLAEKLRIKKVTSLLTINAPATFKKSLGPIPPGSQISASAKVYQQIHWFVKDQAQMNKELNKVLKLLQPEVICWIYYPKGTSKIQTDLTRDKGWENLLQHEEFQWLSLISFDDTWSAFGVRLKTESDKKQEEKTKAARPIFDYVDPLKKTVRLPDDFNRSLRRQKKANENFESLSFSNKKEYIEWIITAKREDTRNERISGSVERLLKGWKNPRNR